MAKIIAVCKSKDKGTRKEDVREGLLKEEFGLVGDAHADCCTHRQVSLLATESIERMRSKGFDIGAVWCIMMLSKMVPELPCSADIASDEQP